VTHIPNAHFGSRSYLQITSKEGLPVKPGRFQLAAETTQPTSRGKHRMSYQHLIIEITGCPPQNAPEVEELMRSEYPTLNHLSTAEFAALARDAYEAMQLQNKL